MKIRNYFTAEPFLGKEFTLPSLTVPDQTMSLRTIIERHSRGLPVVGVPHDPIFQGEDGNGVDWRTLDISERALIADEKRAELELIVKRYKEDQKQKFIDNELAARKAAEEAALAAKKDEV